MARTVDTDMHLRVSSGPILRLKRATQFAVAGIWNARRRWLLAVLGAGIGFGAIHSITIVSGSVDAEIQASMQSLGGDIVTLSIQQESAIPPELSARMHMPAAPSVTGTMSTGVSTDIASVVHLIQSMRGVESAALVQSWPNRCSIANEPLPQSFTVPTHIGSLLSLRIAAGRALSGVDVKERNALIGSDALNELKNQYPHVGVNSVIPTCDGPVRIVGVVAKHAGSDLVHGLGINGSLMFLHAAPGSVDEQALVLVRLKGKADSEHLAGQLRDRVQALLPEHQVRAEGSWALLRARQEQSSLQLRMLAALGGVALLVGILGVANIMLGAVSERRSEIGLRMTVGASRADIVLQFLMESTLMCALGAVVGLLIGTLTADLALDFIGVKTLVHGHAMASTSALALVCGVLAGAYPACRAASVDPAESLRGS
jgi:putative ABC transport system permease protein